MNKPDEKHAVRVHLVMAEAERRAIDDWRRAQPDLPSRSEAIRRLVQLGLMNQQE